MAGDLNADERALAAALIGPLVAPNSSFSADLTNQAKARAAEDVKPVIKSWEKGETIVRVGDRVDDVAFEAIDYFGVNQGGLDVARLVGFVVLSCLVIGLLLVWTWRFRREFWHRNNVLLLLSPLLLFAVFALKLTAGRAWLPYALPLAAVGMLVTVLLDAGVAMIMTALIAVLASAVNGIAVQMGNPIIGLMLAIPLQILNFVICAFTPSIHAVRLNFLEFFGGFFQTSSKEYKPFHKTGGE
jgi:hypothetical protein